LASPPEVAVESPAQTVATGEPEMKPAADQPTSSAASTASPLSEKARQNRNAFFRFIGASLAILISLLLMVLVLLRRTLGF
jgi:hypothetical protein